MIPSFARPFVATAIHLGERRPFLTAVLLGLLAAAALPPVNALPVLFISFPGLVWLLDRAPTRKGAFTVGWGWGFGHFSAGLYWIANALLTDPARFGWMIPFAIFGLAAVLGVFPGLSSLAARAIPTRSLVTRVLVLAMAWAATEWLRGWVLTGFSWNLIVTAWLPVLPVVQFASVVGSYGLAVPLVAAAAMPVVLTHPARHRGAALLASWAVIGVLAGWGAWRISSTPVANVPGVHLRLVQGNVAQTTKWQPELRARHVLDAVTLSREPGWDTLTAVIWPETAVPFFMDGDASVRAAVAQAAPPNGLVITGAPRATPPVGEIRQLWNSLEAVTPSGDIIADYDKAHLVPFGEYVPYQSILPIPKLTAGAIDFSAGPGPQTLELPHLPPVSPSICYEDIFPGEVVPISPRPAWLLNVTNDGWFGNSAGPYQHFAAARLRSIEEGLPLIRAANTGITGAVDPYGRVIARLPLGTRDILDVELPVGLAEAPLFARYGNIMLFSLLLACALIAFLWERAIPTRVGD